MYLWFKKYSRRSKRNTYNEKFGKLFIWSPIRLYCRSRPRKGRKIALCFDRNLFSICLRKIFTELELKNLGRCLSTSERTIREGKVTTFFIVVLPICVLYYFCFKKGTVRRFEQRVTHIKCSEKNQLPNLNAMVFSIWSHPQRILLNHYICTIP